MRIACVAFLALPCMIAAAEDGAAHWPAFRGADGRGVSDHPGLPDRWSATENVAWKTDIEGRGWSSPVVWGDRVFLTTVVSEGAVEEAKKGLYFGGERRETSAATQHWKVLCLELATGARRWEKTVHSGPAPAPVHIKNSYASETPVTDGAHLYVCFGNIGLFCFDLDGNEVWRHPLTPVKTRFEWGPAASPALHGDRLYYLSDNEEQSFLLALDKRTGAEVWRVPREEDSNWSTPFVWQNELRTEIVTTGSDANRSYDLDGNLLWSLTGMSSITIAMPYAADGLLYLSSGYVGDKKQPLFAVKPGASGDITPVEGAATPHLAWHHPKIAPYNPSTLVYKGRLFVLYDRGQVSCFDAKTGAPHYERQKLEGSGGFTSSPWAANGKVFCLDENGACFAIDAGDAFQVLHTNTLGEDDMGMATPALAGGRLLLRTAARLYCIGNPA